MIKFEKHPLPSRSGKLVETKPFTLKIKKLLVVVKSVTNVVDFVNILITELCNYECIQVDNPVKNSENLALG